MSDSLRPHGLQHVRPPCPSPTPGVYSNSCPSNRWYHPTISSYVTPFSCLQSCPASGSFHQTFQWIFRTDIHWDWLVWFPCCPRDSRESSQAPQFESINSSALGLFYGPTLTSLNDYWKTYSFEYIDLCQPINVSGFLICCLGLSGLFFQGASIC